MKQHISKSDWDELDDKQKTRFIIKLWFVKEKRVKTFKPPNIGQMIEYLGNDINSIDNLGNAGWDIILHGRIEDFWEQELVDALFEAVKYKLKNGKKND